MPTTGTKTRAPRSSFSEMDRNNLVTIPMTADSAARLVALLNDHRDRILELWNQEILTDAGEQTDPAALARETRRLLEALTAQLQQEGLEPNLRHWSRLTELLRESTASRARAGGSPRETARQVLALKQALIRVARQYLQGSDAEALMEVMLAAQALVDEMSLLTLEFYMESRERIIQQQSLSLLELSTPVVKLWQRVLLLPLVGVIDTTRAREITESLLEAVARHEAAVTLIDVTGVPVLDTSVAGHLMKTVAAARMLGTRVIITGISPQGAQTLVKLGVDLGEVTTRGSLKSGVAEAFNIIGRRIVPVEPS